MAQRPSISELKRPFLGRWRITGADCFDRDYLDLVGEANILIPPSGNGDMEFGAMTASLEISLAPGMLLFDWNGSDEGDQVSGEGCIELTGDDQAVVVVEYASGDRAVLTAVRRAER